MATTLCGNLRASETKQSTMGRIEANRRGLRLGGLVRMAEAADHPDIRRGYPMIAQSLALAASPQIRNMEVAALYDIRLGERSLLSFYAAPIGDPAIGPTAYPHRMLALRDRIQLA